MKDFKGKCAVITGGASGIGLGLARRLAAEGASIVIADIEADKAETAASNLVEAGAKAIGVACDVADAPATDRLAAMVQERFGGAQLVCANAGVAALKPLLQTTQADWTWLLGVNLIGVVNTVRAFLPSQIEMGGERHILVTASMASLRPPPVEGFTQYTASKFGVLGFCIALEPELAAHGIKLTTLMPGPVETDLSTGATRRTPGRGSTMPVPAGATSGAAMMSPDDAAKIALDAVKKNRAFISTHPGNWPQVEAVHKRIREAFQD